MRISYYVSTPLVILSFLLNLSGVHAENTSMQYLTSIESSRYHLLSSKRLQHDYHVFVLVPDTVEGKTPGKLATVYLLDGGITYPLLAAYSRYLMLADDIPPVIIVGISYGARDFRGGNKRSTDFTAPAASRDYYGGAENFQRMLAEELFPLVEQHYPSDPARRVLFGQSIAGQFAIYNALFDRELFFGLIASNPALHRNLDFFLQPDKATDTDKDKPLLFVSLAENDDPRFKEPAEKWLGHWRNIQEKPFVLKAQTVANHNHFSAAPDAFRNGMRWILEEQSQDSE